MSTVSNQKSAANSVWIVGASTGIGRALALEYAKQDQAPNIIISARSESGLASLKQDIEQQGVSAQVLPLDVTSEDSLEHAVTYLSAVAAPVSQVVVNAGCCEYMDSDKPDAAMARRVMETNYFGAIAISNIALPLLRNARASGLTSGITFVSSSVTYQALPRAHAYGASKSALRYFAECLRIDWQLEGIDVQLVSPGFVDTPLTQVNDFDMPFMVTSEEAGRQILRGIERRKFDIAFPKRFIWMLKTISILPTKWRFALLGKLSRHEPNEQSNSASTSSSQIKGSESP